MKNRISFVFATGNHYKDIHNSWDLWTEILTKNSDKYYKIWIEILMKKKVFFFQQEIIIKIFTTPDLWTEKS